MKQILVFVLTLSLALTMFSGMTAFAESEAVEVSTFAQLRQAIRDGATDISIVGGPLNFNEPITVTGDVTIRNGLGSNPNQVQLLIIAAGSNTAQSHFIVESGASLTLQGCMVRGRRTTPTGGGILVKGGNLILDNTVIDSVVGSAIRAENGNITIKNGSKIGNGIAMNLRNTTTGNGAGINIAGGTLTVEDSELNNNSADGFGGAIYANDTAVSIKNSNFTANNVAGLGGSAAYLVGGTLNIDNEALVGDTIITDGTVVNGGPDIPSDPTKINGSAGITIVRPDPLLPFLLNPGSAQAEELFGNDILGGTGFNFGEHKYSAEAQEIDSLNSLSMIYGYLDPFNEVFTVTCGISDFLLEDGTPIFKNFSLLMRRQNFYADREDYPVAGLASFELAKDDPVVVVKTDAIGHALTNYNSVLKLEQDMTAGLGQANATITWEIGIEVI